MPVLRSAGLLHLPGRFGSVKCTKISSFVKDRQTDRQMNTQTDEMFDR